MIARLTTLTAGALALVLLMGARTPARQGPPALIGQVAAISPAEVRAVDGHLDRMIRDGHLELRLDREDTLVSGRRHRRFTQVVDGVPVYGGDLVRQTDATEQTISVFGQLNDVAGVSSVPGLSLEDAQSLITRLTGVDLAGERAPRLMIVPRAGGGYALAYAARVATAGDITLYFIDATTGAVLQQRSDAQRQSPAVGIGIGVLGDRKKLSASAQGGAFVGSDRQRPPVIETFDMRGNLTRTMLFLNGVVTLVASDLATDTDNDWTDTANVDAHAYAGYTYDYYFRRFGRRGLDNANIRIRSLTHPVLRQNAATAPPEVLFNYYVNAFYAGDGIVVYGEGLPPGSLFGGQSWNFRAGGLDVVGHELTHGVIDYSSQLIYENESGALNEAFADMMATAIEFFFQPPGSGPGRADYVLGEDIVTPGGIRSMINPAALGDPDHYSRRYTGSDDNGGVHTNSGIANNAYYLAIEGGTNRTSGLTVQGVGQANREQIEKVFYRAFTQLLPANATFSTARTATIQSARDLYGSDSPAERAVAQAWTAVGVN